MANIALNGNVSADSTIIPFSADRAVDGSMDATHRWVGQVPCSLILTCTGPQLVNRWVVKGMSGVTGWNLPAWPSPDYSLCDFLLEGSQDKKTWTAIDTVTGNTLPVIDRTLPAAVYYPYYRVRVTKGLNCNGTIVSILDFELYNISTSPYLSNLTISSGTLNPAFNKNIFNYSMTVGSNVDSITLVPTAEVPAYQDKTAVISVNGTAVQNGSGIAVALNMGVNTINIDVTSAVGGVVQRYVLTVMRVDVYLSNVKIMAVRAAVSLTPAFSSTQFSYTGSCAKTFSLTVMPAADDPDNVTIYVNDKTVVSGASISVAVASGQSNAFSITVQYNKDSTFTQTYNFVITVAAS